jgi:hypothetical protein
MIFFDRRFLQTMPPKNIRLVFFVSLNLKIFSNIPIFNLNEIRKLEKVHISKKCNGSVRQLS